MDRLIRILFARDLEIFSQIYLCLCVNLTSQRNCFYCINDTYLWFFTQDFLPSHDFLPRIFCSRISAQDFLPTIFYTRFSAHNVIYCPWFSPWFSTHDFLPCFSVHDFLHTIFCPHSLVHNFLMTLPGS